MLLGDSLFTMLGSSSSSFGDRRRCSWEGFLRLTVSNAFLYRPVFQTTQSQRQRRKACKSTQWVSYKGVVASSAVSGMAWISSIPAPCIVDPLHRLDFEVGGESQLSQSSSSNVSIPGGVQEKRLLFAVFALSGAGRTSWFFGGRLGPDVTESNAGLTLDRVTVLSSRDWLRERAERLGVPVDRGDAWPEMGSSPTVICRISSTKARIPSRKSSTI